MSFLTVTTPSSSFDTEIITSTPASSALLLGERLRACGRELHPEKTQIVYCHDGNRQGTYPTIQFTFLGYTFRPRRAVDKYGRVYVNFSPGVSRAALKTMRQTVRGWHLQLMNDKELSDLSKLFGPVLRGWANYYARFHGSALKPLWRQVNDYLVRWLRRKHKHLARGVTRAVRAWAVSRPTLHVYLCIGSGDSFPRLGDGSRMS